MKYITNMRKNLSK